MKKGDFTQGQKLKTPNKRDIMVSITIGLIGLLFCGLFECTSFGNPQITCNKTCILFASRVSFSSYCAKNPQGV